MSKYLTEKQTAALTGFSRAKLRLDRGNSTGINFYRIGRSIRYKESDVFSFMESHRIITENNLTGRVIIKRRTKR